MDKYDVHLNCFPVETLTHILGYCGDEELRRLPLTGDGLLLNKLAQCEVRIERDFSHSHAYRSTVALEAGIYSSRCKLRIVENVDDESEVVENDSAMLEMLSRSAIMALDILAFPASLRKFVLYIDPVESKFDLSYLTSCAELRVHTQTCTPVVAFPPHLQTFKSLHLDAETLSLLPTTLTSIQFGLSVGFVILRGAFSRFPHLVEYAHHDDARYDDGQDFHIEELGLPDTLTRLCTAYNIPVGMFPLLELADCGLLGGEYPRLKTIICPWDYSELTINAQNIECTDDLFVDRKSSTVFLIDIREGTIKSLELLAKSIRTLVIHTSEDMGYGIQFGADDIENLLNLPFEETIACINKEMVSITRTTKPGEFTLSMMLDDEEFIFHSHDNVQRVMEIIANPPSFPANEGYTFATVEDKRNYVNTRW